LNAEKSVQRSNLFARAKDKKLARIVQWGVKAGIDHEMTI
jgi:hypothetical protein